MSDLDLSSVCLLSVVEGGETASGVPRLGGHARL